MSALPCNVDAEKFVLGSVMLDDSFFPAVAGAVVPDDFALDQHQKIFRRMLDLHARGEKIEPLTVANEMLARKQLDGDGMSYIVSLDDGIPRVPSIDSYVRIVQRHSLSRRIIFAAQAVINRAMLGTESALDIAEDFRRTAEQLLEAGRATTQQPVSTAEMIANIGVDALLSPRRHGGVSLPWKRLDGALSGFSAGQIVVVLGETSRGKTSFALQAATAVGQQGKTALVWTMEMSPRSLFRRMVNQISGLPISSRPMDATFDERERHRLAVGHLADHPIYFDGHSRSVSGFCASIRRVAQQAPLGLVVVDYLQLIRSVSSQSRAQQVSEASRNLKLAAMDFGVPIMVLSQVDRSSVKGKDARIGLHSAKESGDVENDADVLLAIQAPQLSRDADTPVQIEVQKQREGACGFSIPMVFRPLSQTFMESYDEVDR